MKESIEVRPAQAEDAEFIIEAQIKMAFESEELKLDKKTVSLGVNAVFGDKHKGRYLVAEIEGQKAGALLIINEWSDWRNANVLWIHSVYVVPEFRKLGVYKSMYLHLKNEVQVSDDLAGIRLYVEKTNTKATAVYRKLDMTDEHYNLFEWLKPL